MKTELKKTFNFEAAHRLPQLPDSHKCSRLHGHSFVVEVVVEGDVNPALGWFVDFHDIKSVTSPLIDALDHTYLNDIEGLEIPTSENIALWIYDRLQPDLPGLKHVTVCETRTSSCTYNGRGFNTSG